MNKKIEINKKIVKFFSEVGMLKRLRHEGYRLAGVDDPVSLETHLVRAAQIGFVLAYLENADPYKVATICIFHDNEETRIGDQTKVAAGYFSTKDFKAQAVCDQFANLPEDIAKRISNLIVEHNERNTKEGIVAKDADWLEIALTAKEYLELGHKGMQNWIDNVRAALQTKSAQKILALIEKESDFTNYWWQGLKKMTHKKLK